MRPIVALLLAIAGFALATVARSAYDVGLRLRSEPELVMVPGLPVAVAPALEANYFFHDGLYWVFQNDSWFVSRGFDGPWELVNPVYVPPALLAVPVAHYRRPPEYFGYWPPRHAPRWRERWGRQWEHQHGQVFGLVRPLVPPPSTTAHGRAHEPQGLIRPLVPFPPTTFETRPPRDEGRGGEGRRR